MPDVRSLLRTELASRAQSNTTKPSSKKRKASHDEPSDPRSKKSRSISSNQTLAALKEHHQASESATPPKRHSLHVAAPPDLDTVPEEESPSQAETVADAPVPLDEPSKIVEAADLDAHPGAILLDSISAGAPDPNADINEHEWAAFEADITAASTETTDVPTIFNAPAAISAAPMTAEEIAAQAREEQSSQRGRREVEAEEEKEERDVKMLEEFEEMEGLEERVRRLRERREALRAGVGVEGTKARTKPAATDADDPLEKEGVAVGDESGQDSSDDDEVDFWAGR